MEGWKVGMTFVKGQRVHVEFDGVIDLPCTNSAYVTSGNTTRWVSHKDITPLDPENWPPQVGDIWEAEGTEYYVRENRSRGLLDTIVVDRFAREGRVFSESRLNGTANLNTFKSLSPTLVRR